jgi:hypothetical protein
MRAQKVLARDFQFYFPDLDNILLVECHEDESVTVRASKDNVTDERKICFIRKLAAEGFIPDQYQWYSGSTDGSVAVRWVKDYSWLKTHQPSKRRSNRVMARMFVAACVLWLAMMRVLIVSGDHRTAGKPKASTPVVASLVPGNPLAELKSEHQTVTDHHTAGNPPLGVTVLEEHGANNLDRH